MMKNKMLSIMLVVSVVCLAMTAPASADFEAYLNPCNSTVGNVIGIELAETKTLVDYTSGLATPVSVELVDGAANDTAGSNMPNAGTDAYITFNGKITGDDIVGYGSNTGWYCELVFTGLVPSSTYEFVSLQNRGTYTDRWTVISIVDADASTYASTATAFKISETSVSMVASQATTGEVARWTGIKSGANGTFTIHYTHSTAGAGIDRPTGSSQDGRKAYGPTGFMLVEVADTSNPCDVAKAAATYTEDDALAIGDTNYDCEVDLVDLAAMAYNWLADKTLI